MTTKKGTSLCVFLLCWLYIGGSISLSSLRNHYPKTTQINCTFNHIPFLGKGTNQLYHISHHIFLNIVNWFSINEMHYIILNSTLSLSTPLVEEAFFDSLLCSDNLGIFFFIILQVLVCNKTETYVCYTCVSTSYL